MKKTTLSLLLTVLIIVNLPGIFMSGCGKLSSAADGLSENPVTETNKKLSTKLKEYMTAYNENCSYKYSGAVLVAKGDEILLNQGYGMANYEEKIPNKPDTVFAVGSITKSFTAAAIMQLQEKGLLNVNDPISKYIDGNKRGDDITIHQLLAHTSGLDRNGIMKLYSDVPMEKNIDFINAQSLISEPGEKFLYSNAGYIILAAIIEKVSGKSYNDYIRDSILKPLKMSSSSLSKDAFYVKNQAVGYENLKDAPRKMLLVNFSWDLGAGNVFSTVEDLYKYDRALCGEKLLSKESLDKMFTSYSDANFGYGWEVKERYGHREISHSGYIYGYHSSMIRFPDDDFVLIFLTNSNDSAALNEVSGNISAVVLGQDYVIPRKINPVEVNPETLKKYAGKYQMGEGIIVTMEYRNGRLNSEAGDGISYEFIPISETEFYPKNFENSRAKFILDNGGNAAGLETISGGVVRRGNKSGN